MNEEVIIREADWAKLNKRTHDSLSFKVNENVNVGDVETLGHEAKIFATADGEVWFKSVGGSEPVQLTRTILTAEERESLNLLPKMALKDDLRIFVDEPIRTNELAAGAATGNRVGADIARQNDLLSHTTRKDNPHDVTAEQLNIPPWAMQQNPPTPSEIGIRTGVFIVRNVGTSGTNHNVPISPALPNSNYVVLVNPTRNQTNNAGHTGITFAASNDSESSFILRVRTETSSASSDVAFRWVIIPL